MASAFSAALEASMRELIDTDVIDACKQVVDECTYLSLNGAGKKMNSRGKRMTFWNTSNGNAGYRSEGGNYLAGGSPTLAAMRCFATTFTMTAAYTERFLRQVDGEDVIVDGLAEYMERDKRAILDNKSQDMWEDGSGQKAKVSGISSGVVTCLATAAARYFGAMKITEGELVEFRSSAGVLRSGGGPTTGVVSAVDNANRTFTLTGASGTDYPNDIAANDIVCRPGSYNNAITGLLRAVNNDSLDFQGANRGRFKKLRASVYDASSAPPEYNNLNVLKYRLRVRSTVTKKRDLCTSTSIAQAIEQQGHALRRYTETAESQNLDFEKFKMDGSEAMVFMYCPADHLFFIDRDEIEWNVLAPLGPIDRDGSIFRLAPTSSGNYSDNWLIHYVEEGDIGYRNVRNLGRAHGFDLTGLELPCDSADL